MATIGAIDPTTAAASQAATSGSSTAASPTQGLEKTANTETFLKLLVTQMRNQDRSTRPMARSSSRSLRSSASLNN